MPARASLASSRDGLPLCVVHPASVQQPFQSSGLQTLCEMQPRTAILMRQPTDRPHDIADQGSHPDSGVQRLDRVSNVRLKGCVLYIRLRLHCNEEKSNKAPSREEGLSINVIPEQLAKAILRPKKRTKRSK